MITETVSTRIAPRVALALLLALGLAACGAKLVRDESPMVRINELSHQGDALNLQLSIRNVNDEPLDALRLSFSLSSDGQELLAWNGEARISIAANGTETWSVDLSANEYSRRSLDALERGEIMSLPYVLEGEAATLDSGTLRFEAKGHIYPLPGKPGHFR